MAEKRPRIEPTHDWDTLVPLFWWPEQEEYEQLRPPVLFNTSVPERAEEVGVSESTLSRRIEGFRDYGMESFFTEKPSHGQMPDNFRRLIVDLKAEYPAFNTNEIANIVQACFGHKPDVRSVRKVTIAAIEEVRKLAQNPELGAFRVYSALKQKGFNLSRATCGRILARVRELYGYEKPQSGGVAKKKMPFASSRHHEYWTADVRYLDMLDEKLLADGMVYATTIIENYSRAVLASCLLAICSALDLLVIPPLTLPRMSA